MNRIVIGSVQFGMNYGINNKVGQVTQREVFNILDYCLSNNILEIDTSYLYNESETVLGQYKKINHFNIISKCPSIDNNINKYFSESINKLKSKNLYGYLIHHFKFFKENTDIWSKLKKLKNDKFTYKIGFSLYYPYEFEELINLNIIPDIVQIPYNIFDQRFDYIIKDEKYKNIEFYSRSTFLQGLFFITPENLSNNFKIVKDKINLLHNLSLEQNISISELCLKFVLKNKYIDKVIVGVDNLEQLKIINKLVYTNDLSNEIYKNLKSLREDNENIILPFNWSK